MINETNSSFVLMGREGKRFIIDNPFAHATRALHFSQLAVFGQEMLQKTTMHSNGAYAVTVTELGRHIGTLKVLDLLTTDHDVEFHPLLCHLFNAYLTHPIRDYVGYIGHSVARTVPKIQDLFDHFVATMRSTAVEQNLRKVAADWESKFLMSDARLLEVTDKVVSNQMTTGVIMLDLDSRPVAFSDEQINSILERLAHRTLVLGDAPLPYSGRDVATSIGGIVKIADVQRDRERLFKAIRSKRSLFGYLEGYAWRIKWTPFAGTYLRLALFFDLDQNDQLSTTHLPSDIGQYWQSRITEHNGRFRVATEDLIPKSSDSGLGWIHQNDQDALDQFRRRLSLAFGNGVPPFQLKTAFNTHMFGSGLIRRR